MNTFGNRALSRDKVIFLGKFVWNGGIPVVTGIDLSAQKLHIFDFPNKSPRKININKKQNKNIADLALLAIREWNYNTDEAFQSNSFIHKSSNKLCSSFMSDSVHHGRSMTMWYFATI